MNCINCGEHIQVKTVVRNMTLTCSSCGCIMKCLDSNGYISRLRVMNPFDIEDKRSTLK